MITLFTPSFADEANTNAQNLSVKEIVARLDPEKIAVTMLHQGAVDPRIASRPNTKLIRWQKHGNTGWLILQLLREVRDVYFFPREGPLDAAFLTLRRYLHLKTTVVSYVVSGGLESGPYLPARQRHIREADAVFANNTHLARLLKDNMGIDAAGVVYDGVDRRYFFPAEVHPQDQKQDQKAVAILYAGSLKPLKRVPLVVRQAARWPQAVFRIAGTGEEEIICRNLAAELGCKNVEFLGHLPPAQLGEEMRKSNIFFFPSIVEGHPQVLAQAAATGLPCVAMKVYRPDFVVDRATGFLAESDTELAELLDRLICDQELRLRMKRAAIAHIQKFDWDVSSKIWQDAFERLVARRRKH
ncbi:MAG TPA: glycosyltransferase family 4 protein [Verrucomicrobiae bacterium]|jgi:glycosyltransferase involved in cell wall biosynthesis|nr:glycosyltransferase family 4 protein [Verrucomicrobiae bacterium]